MDKRKAPCWLQQGAFLLLFKNFVIASSANDLAILSPDLYLRCDGYTTAAITI
ncbi:hypothetical protein KHS38_15555 [Mucilaginibacter sp. Bleaf8]|uniref:hypothetical protein n=1 Tax=Mucilaginibacter sp. Bleaf8 TaxID=2834430 RepID=UPI001BD0ABD5|nr:hypothetical protein [Mucilaginibacter sp. Bleaf8]MBS7565823.1 hypothetical protein [Mucilaginibacter sp. Bleaf8]